MSIKLSNRVSWFLIVPLIFSLIAVVTSYYWKQKLTHTEQGELKMTQETVKTITPSGLAYIILKEAPAHARKPQPGDLIEAHYTGWLDNAGEPGKKFDSSLDRGEPLSFPVGVGYVIKGWDEGLLDMKQGEKRRLFIPANLGYGARGAGALIPPHANLIFDVELIHIDSGDDQE